MSMTKQTNFRLYGFYRNKDGTVGALFKDNLGCYPIMVNRYTVTIASPYNMQGKKKTRVISKAEAKQLVDDIKHNPNTGYYELTLKDIHEFVKKHRKGK